MLSNHQKASILQKVGLAVPPPPPTSAERTLVERALRVEGATDEEHRLAEDAWQRTVETLYAGYAAARAAKSLRESEEAHLMERLRELK